MAVGLAFGPDEGLAVAEPLLTLPATKDNHLLAAVVGDLHCRAGHHERAEREFLRAAALTGNNRERTVMLERAARCAARHDDSGP